MFYQTFFQTLRNNKYCHKCLQYCEEGPSPSKSEVERLHRPQSRRHIKNYFLALNPDTTQSLGSWTMALEDPHRHTNLASSLPCAAILETTSQHHRQVKTSPKELVPWVSQFVAKATGKAQDFKHLNYTWSNKDITNVTFLVNVFWTTWICFLSSQTRLVILIIMSVLMK